MVASVRDATISPSLLPKSVAELVLLLGVRRDCSLCIFPYSPIRSMARSISAFTRAISFWVTVSLFSQIENKMVKVANKGTDVAYHVVSRWLSRRNVSMISRMFLEDWTQMVRLSLLK